MPLHRKGMYGIEDFEAIITFFFFLPFPYPCILIKKILNAQKAGAIGVLIYNNVPGIIPPVFENKSITIQTAGISDTDGAKLFDDIQKNGKDHNVLLTFTQERVEFENPTAGTFG